PDGLVGGGRADGPAPPRAPARGRAVPSRVVPDRRGRRVAAQLRGGGGGAELRARAYTRHRLACGAQSARSSSQREASQRSRRCPPSTPSTSAQGSSTVQSAGGYSPATL